MLHLLLFIILGHEVIDPWGDFKVVLCAGFQARQSESSRCRRFLKTRFAVRMVAVDWIEVVESFNKLHN